MSCVLTAQPFLSSVLTSVYHFQPERTICNFRHIFQLHHDDGGQQCGPHGGRPQLSPQDSGDPRHASLGPQCLPPVAALATQDEQTEEKNISQNNNDEQ